MTDETINKESVPAGSGEVGTPNQTASEQQGADTSAVDVDSLKAILGPLVEAEVERRTQSIKDKRIARHESEISSLKDTLAELKTLQSEGMSEKQALQYMEMKEALAKLGGSVGDEAPPVQEKATQPSVAVGDYLSPLLRLSGLDANDSAVIDIVRNERDPAKQMTAIANLAETRKQVAQKPANPAAVLPAGGGHAPDGETVESVTAELNEEIGKPHQNKERIRELNKKLKSFTRQY